MTRSLTSLLLTGFILFGVSISCFPPSFEIPLNRPGPSARADARGFIRAQGRDLVRNGQRIILKSICFSNNYSVDWDKLAISKSEQPSERDFQRVIDLGMNSVRFAFNANWHETNPADFWTWLDRNVYLARKLDIYLILDMHIPIGGFWLDLADKKADYRIWTDSNLKKRNLSLWKAIATRYQNEQTIAAYDILNEPITTDQTGEQWRKLAQKLVDEIRAVDNNHLIIIEQLYGTNKAYNTDSGEGHFLVDDSNVMYDFHFYEPMDYTHQYASWIARPLGDGGKYPDPDIIFPTGEQVFIASSGDENLDIASGNSEWTEYTGKPFRVVNNRIVAALPVLVVNGNIKGTVYFDNFKVTEYSNNGTITRTVMTEPLSAIDVLQWWGWVEPEAAGHATFEQVTNDGANDSSSLSISNASGNNIVSGWSSDNNWLRVKHGNQYQISGYMKGVELDTSPNGNYTEVNLELAFYGDPTGAGRKGFIQRDKEYLELEFMKHFQFGIDHGVPMSVMEFGLLRYCFEMPGKGGSHWVADVLEIFRNNNVSFAYWNYHGDRMGLYLSDEDSAPGLPNTELITTLKKELIKWRH